MTNWSYINAETDDKQDFVILLSGERVFGEVVRNYNYADFEKVTFVSSGKESIYLPGEILGFGLSNGQIFQSKPLPEETRPVFLQLLVTGPIHLGEYKGVYYLDNGKDYKKLQFQYTDLDKESPSFRKISKPYILPLKQFLSGDCGVPLYPQIDRAPYNAQSFIRILKAYFDCNQSEYLVHIEKIPFVMISPIFGAGVSSFGLVPAARLDGRADRLQRTIGGQVFAGYRFHDSRVLPRLSADVRLVFSSFQTELLSSTQTTQVYRTGSEKIVETAISVPFGVSYSLLKRQKQEIYFGPIMSFWSPKITFSEGMIDERFLTRDEVFIYETPIAEYQGANVYFGAKLGGSFLFSKKVKLFAELEGTIQPQYYKAALVQNLAFYDRSRITFQIGIEL